MWVRRSFRPLLLVAALFTLVFTGCKHQQDVVGNSILQKRKHRPGFHLNLRKHTPYRDVAAKNDADQETTRHNRESSPKGLTNGKVQAANKQEIPASHLADRHASYRHQLLTARSRKAPHSLKDEAKRRTNELEERKDNEERNRRNLVLTASLSGTAIFLIAVSLLLDFFLAIESGLFVLIFSYGLLFFLPLLIIFLIERRRLKKGESFFTPKRVANWIKFIRVMKTSQMVMFLTFIFCGFALAVLLLNLWNISDILLAALVLGIHGSLILLTIISILGIVCALAVRAHDESIQKMLDQLISIHVIAPLIYVAFAVVVILLILL